MGVTSSVIHAVGAPAGGISASPKTLVVLVINKRSHACRHRLFQQVERPGHIRVDKRLPAMSRNMRLVQCGCMKDILYALHTSPHESPVADGADLRRKWRRKDVEADDLMFQVSQSADKGLTEVTRAACNQNSHTRLPPGAKAIRIIRPLRAPIGTTPPSSFQTISNPDRRTSGQYRRATAKNATCRFFGNHPMRA